MVGRLCCLGQKESFRVILFKRDDVVLRLLGVLGVFLDWVLHCMMRRVLTRYGLSRRCKVVGRRSRDNNVMHAKPGLRVVLGWKIARPGSVITDVIRTRGIGV